MKVLSEEEVNSCPVCDNSRTSGKFQDYHKIEYARCAQCGMVYQNPRLHHEYSDSYWKGAKDPDGIERDLTKECEFKIKNWYGDAVAFVNKMHGGRILDAGAGLGFYLSSLGDHWEKHALDVSDYAVQFIHEHYPEITAQSGTLQTVTFPDHHFDVIMFYHVIEHLNHPSEILEIMFQILKPNGTLIIGTPNAASPAAKIFGGNFRLYGPGHVCLYNPRNLKQMLSNHQFRVRRVEYPYWKTDYATFSSLLRMFQPWKVSPPFWGSIMTLYAEKEERS